MKKRSIFLIISLSLGIFACGIAAPSVNTSNPQSVGTVVAATIQAITAAAPAPMATPAPQGISVSYNNVNFIIPNGLADGANNSTTTNVEFPYINPSNGDMPSHISILLNNYSVSNSNIAPQILVFKTTEFAQYGDADQQIVSALQTLHNSSSTQSLPDGLPGSFSAQIKTIDFANGRGLRYLIQVDQAALPINNRDLFYYFIGLTNDGNYFIEALFPTGISFLSNGDDLTTVPAGGIAFPDTTSNPSPQDFTDYYQAVSDKLNTTSPDVFNPSLTQLDALIQSIQINP